MFAMDSETFDQKLRRWNDWTSQYSIPLDVAVGSGVGLGLYAAKVDPAIVIIASFGIQIYLHSVISNPKKS